MTEPLARVLRIVGHREAVRILESLGVAPRASEVLRRSVLHRVVHVGPVASDAARALRREMLRLGGEAALPEGAADSIGTVDVLLAGTLADYDHLLRALSVGESMGPRTADTYPAYLEGQSLPLDGIPAGRYYLVIWVNRERRLRESNYRNDVGSTLVRIAYSGGLAQVKALASCFHPPPCR